MLYDRARIFVAAGAGGDGCLSFRREAHVPRGGPDGGDGGHGGAVVVQCDPALRDLQAFRRRQQFRAQRGGHGSGALRHGRNGDELVVRVPPGTQVLTDTGDVHDLTRPEQRVRVARGGSGGRGNKHFATATRQAPRFAERGLAGEEAWLELRLKLLADVGLIGLPNAGKSSLLARLTRATPKIADYPFTTLTPNLGVVDLSGNERFVIADVPGLIEGASEGLGLGTRFLGHLERTAVLIHLIDATAEDPVAAWRTIRGELEAYGEGLDAKPELIVLNKVDALTEDERKTKARAMKRAAKTAPLLVSGVSGEGVRELLRAAHARVRERDAPAADAQAAESWRP